MSDKVVMSDEQFEKLLKAIAEIGRTYPHVCPPCLRQHVPQYPYYYPYITYPPVIYSTGGTTNTIKVF